MPRSPPSRHILSGPQFAYGGAHRSHLGPLPGIFWFCTSETTKSPPVWVDRWHSIEKSHRWNQMCSRSSACFSEVCFCAHFCFSTACVVLRETVYCIILCILKIQEINCQFLTHFPQIQRMATSPRHNLIDLLLNDDTKTHRKSKTIFFAWTCFGIPCLKIYTEAKCCASLSSHLIWVFVWQHVGKYTIHGAYGYIYIIYIRNKTLENHWKTTAPLDGPSFLATPWSPTPACDPPHPAPGSSRPPVTHKKFTKRKDLLNLRHLDQKIKKNIPYKLWWFMMIYVYSNNKNGANL